MMTIHRLVRISLKTSTHIVHSDVSDLFVFVLIQGGQNLYRVPAQNTIIYLKITKLFHF